MNDRIMGAAHVNPFRPEFAGRTPEGYAQTVRGLARHFIYDEGDLDAATITKEIDDALRDPAVAAAERTEHRLESLRHLLQGIEAHERANLLHGGAWQAALIRQETRRPEPPRSPETLTRTEVANEYDAFKFRDLLANAERDALTHYERVMELSTGPIIELSRNISLHKTDIEVLVNDIRVRIAEHINDDALRGHALNDLDRDLAGIIDRLTDDEWGKRFELEEIYLLRRLIHAADMGHLASVSHGTPRQDLNPDRGSVDIQITAAGDRYEFQMKTLKRGVSRTTRERQQDVLERAHRNVRGSTTHLVALESEPVQETYERSLRQAKNVPTSLADKYAALEPIAGVLRSDERHRLLTVLGLTEEGLIQEQEESARKLVERRKLEEELREKRRVEAELDAKLEAGLKEREIRAAMEEREREAEEERRRAEARVAAQAERDAQTEAKRAAMEERRAKRTAERAILARETAAREAEAAAAREAEARSAERKRKREEKMNETPGWPPKDLKNLGTAPVLKNIGLLPEDWSGDAGTFLAAKKRFLALFAKPKRGKPPMETDRPDAFFADVFPTHASLEAPTAEDLERMRALVKQK